MHQVRPARNEDIPAIMELLRQVNLVHHLGRPDLFKQGTKYTAEQLLAILENPDTPVFVCTNDSGAVLGHAFCVLQQHINENLLTDIKTLYIDDICVNETLRGKHVGKTLYDYVLAFAREQGCYNVTLNVWTCNPGALKFYEACGMVPQKTGMETIL